MELDLKLSQSTECPICLDMLYAPVSTQCGHNFCMTCLEEVVRNRFYHAKCPICRSILPASGYRVNHLLENFLSMLFPKEYQLRSQSSNNQAALNLRYRMRIKHGIKLVIIVCIGIAAGWYARRALPELKLRAILRLLSKLLSFIFTIICGHYSGFGQMLISNFVTTLFRSSIVW
ncbi:unnamed protein product [Blepharisma stoltei]|uniref:RING-type domain-containing protein n=1 Tax=Blepharisma stoltei TaxID=1481888 RepID=A0AAU9IDX4_9CILI|nr:unnamed protein product [Blepharisma stoltei]